MEREISCPYCYFGTLCENKTCKKIKDNCPHCGSPINLIIDEHFDPKINLNNNSDTDVLIKCEKCKRGVLVSRYIEATFQIQKDYGKSKSEIEYILEKPSSMEEYEVLHAINLYEHVMKDFPTAITLPLHYNSYLEKAKYVDNENMEIFGIKYKLQFVSEIIVNNKTVKNLEGNKDVFGI